MADYCAGVRAAFYLAGVEREVPYVCAIADRSEQSDVIFTGTVDCQSEYTVSKTVEASGEMIVHLANRIKTGTAHVISSGGRVRVDGVAECVPTAFVLVHRLQLV